MADTTRVEQAFEAFNRHDDAYFDLYTDDVTVHGLPGMASVDKDGVKGFYNAFWSAFPDGTIEPVDVAGDDLVATRLFVKGTHRGEIMGVAPSGNEISVEQITIMKLDGEGRCVERWVRLDEFGFLQQIGAMPVPEPAPA